MREETTVVHCGLHPERRHGAVNPPVFHASTILSETVAEFRRRRQNWILEQPGTYYGRFGTPTIEALQKAVAPLEEGYRSVVYPSGLAACAGALLAFLSAGDRLLMSDTVYGPTRNFANGFLKRFGVSTTFFDPLAGHSIESLIRPETRAIYLESPGSLTFEVQDVPAIAEAARRRGITERALCAMIDGLELYGIGSSWGGFESLIVPFDPRETRTATQWPHKGPCFRVHAGLENVEDLIADLEAGFKRLRST